MWLQYDFGDGPRIGGVKTILFVAWLAFSRFRIVIPLRDRTAPSVFAALDRCFRILGGAPTYVLTDNEKTVTTAHVAGVPVRNQQTLDFARHYGITVLTCQPADPATKGRRRSVRETGQGRHRPQGHQPPRRLRHLRRTRDRVPGVHE
jgi:transposase